MRTLSVIVPMYNESDVLPLFVERLRPVLDRLDVSYEVIAVDDGSTDDTATHLQRVRRTWDELRILRLRANAGHQAALSAGLAAARGDWMVSLDADLQDPPEVITDMLAAATDQQVDVVYAVRNDRTTDSAFKRHTARAFYRLMGTLNKQSGPADAGDFRLMSRPTVDAVLGLPEHNRVLRLVVPELGFPSATVTYRRAERAAGSSKYPLSKMLRLSLDAITGASIAPLRLATWLGLIGFLASLGLVAYALIAWASGQVVSGWTSTLAAVAGVGAVQLLCLGIVGEYLGRLYVQHQQRPTYYIAYDSCAGQTEHSAVTDLRDSATTSTHPTFAGRTNTSEPEATFTPHNSGSTPNDVDVRTATRGRRARKSSPTDSGSIAEQPAVTSATKPSTAPEPTTLDDISLHTERRAEILDIAGVERRHRRPDVALGVTITDTSVADPSDVLIPELVSPTSSASTSRSGLDRSGLDRVGSDGSASTLSGSDAATRAASRSGSAQQKPNAKGSASTTGPYFFA